MRKIFILLPIAGMLMYIFLSSNSAGPGLSGMERTGASGGTVGCGGGTCHGTVATAATTITAQLYSGGVPVPAYTGGSSYTIKITGVNTGATSLPKFGFQVGVVKNLTTTNAGTLSAITGTHTVTASGINLVEHSGVMSPTTGTGGTGTTYVVDIPWTAPVAGTGAVKIYAVLNAVTFTLGADPGDKWNNTSVVVNEITTGISPITGTFAICVGGTTTLTDATPGGTWSSGTPAVATIGATSGIVSGLTAGTTVITYTVGASSVTATMTVNPVPTAITGTLSLCVGGSSTLASTPAGGTWSSATTAVATVGSSSGLTSGVGAGTSVITYALATGCRKTAMVTVSATAPITGPDTVCTGATITLAHATTGGTWSSATPAVGTVGASTGVVAGITLGTTVISYTLPGGCVATKTVVVRTVPGTITGASAVCVGTTTTLTENVAGGTWSATNTHATVGSATGIVAGVTVGVDTIRYTVTNSCGTGTATKVVTVNPATMCATGILTANNNTADGISLYPNPTHDGYFTLNLASEYAEDAKIIITNVVGSAVKEFSISTNTATQMQLGTTPGIYLLTAITAHSRQVVKLVVE